MKTPAGQSLCPQTPLLHKLDTRCTVIEHEFANVRESVTKIGTKVDGIESALSKQNGAIPGLQTSMVTVLTKLQTLEKNSVEGSASRKMIWPLVTGVVMIVVGILAGKFM